MSCSRCGAYRSEQARFCPMCGLLVPGGAEPVPDEVRFVTVVFCDVVDAVGRRADVLAGYFTAATDALTAGGGRLEKFIGDSVVAVFGTGPAREDDAARAVRAACAVRDGSSGFVAEGGDGISGIGVSVRLGVASGPVALSPPGDSSFAIGAVLNRAARLQGAAGQQEVYMDARTWLLTRTEVTAAPAGTVAAKSFQGGIEAWRVDSADAPAATEASGEFVGRAQVRTALGEHLRTGLGGAGPVVAVVTGEAGIGKSRLVERCWQDLGEPYRIVVRCAADGTQLGLGAVLALAGGTSTVDASTGLARPLTEVHWEIRQRLVEATQRHSVLFVVDDAQWASPALLDLLRTLSAVAVPRLAIVLSGRTAAAPDGFDDVTRRFTVPPLDVAEAAELVGGIASADLVRRSGGNPLYLDQLRILAEEAGTDLVPLSAGAVVGARVDRLSADARQVLAALHAFGGAATVEDLSAAAGSSVEEQVARLTSERFVDLTARLVQCAVPAAAELAYARLPAARRADLHGHLARSLRGRLAADPAAIERVAHHAVRAQDAWREGDPASDAHLEAARYAVWALCDAARFAVLHGASSTALAYVRMAGETICDDPAATLEVASIEAYAHLAGGRPAPAQAIAETALDRLPSSANRAAAADLMLTTAATTRLVAGGADPARIARARTLAGDSRDPAVIARSLLFQAHEATGTGDYRTAERALVRAVDLLAGATGALSVAEIYGNLALCLAYSDQPAPRAREMCARLHRSAGHARTLRAAIGGPLAYLHHLEGDVAGAQALLNDSARVCAELGYRSGLAGILGFHAVVAEREGDLPQAVRHLHRVVEVCRVSGLDDVVRSATLRRDVLVALVRGIRPSHVPPAVAKGSWRDEVARHQMAALHHGDATRLAPALQVLDAVRGSGAVVAGLLTCMRVARRLAAAAIAGDCAERLRTAARTKADTFLLANELSTTSTPTPVAGA
jgi:class 3 adenylate cyclase